MSKKHTPIQEILLELHKEEDFRIKWNYDYAHIQQLFNEEQFELTLRTKEKKRIIITKRYSIIEVLFIADAKQDFYYSQYIKIVYNGESNKLSYNSTELFEDSLIEKVVQKIMYSNMPPKLIILIEKEELARFERKEYGYLSVENQQFLSFKDVERLHNLAFSKIENKNTIVLNIKKEEL